LFYITPLFSLAFTSLDRIILLDTADLDFFSDILLLDDQFRNMIGEVIGVGLDPPPTTGLCWNRLDISPPTRTLSWACGGGSRDLTWGWSSSGWRRLEK
jgi:hypothetical protein